MTYRLTADTKGNMSSRRFIAMETKPTLDLDALERQALLDKSAGNSKTRVHICHVMEIIKRLRLVEGVKPKEDLRRIFGS